MMEDKIKDVDMLSSLAEKYRIQGSQNPELYWADMLKAHTLYNACEHRTPDARWCRAAYGVQRLYWNGRVIISFEDQQKLTQDLKKQLDLIREQCNSETSLLTSRVDNWDPAFASLDLDYSKHLNKTFSDGSKLISLVCNTKMKVFAGGLIQKAVEICQSTCPCKFAAVAMGSLAKGEATPYSDLEFLFLVETKTSETIQYFELLAMTVYFLIGNLQETKLKYMNIKELKHFVDRCTNGFKIDGLQPKAGNIPTGNSTPEQKNKFILTVDELLTKYRAVWEKPDPVESLKGDLTSMLAHTTTLYGDPSLLNRFEEERLKLRENAARSETHLAMLQQDLIDYSFMPTQDLLKTYYNTNLKSAIYRYPSILIFNLKIVYNIRSINSWDTLDQLLHVKLISDSFYNSLKFLLATAQYIRLAAYLHHGSQNECITFLQPAVLHNENQQSQFWHVPKPLAVQMSLHITSVKQTLDDNNATESVLVILKSRIKSDEEINRAALHYTLLDFQEAITILERKSADSRTLYMMHLLACCYLEADTYGDKPRKLIEDIIDEYTHRETLQQCDHQQMIISWKVLLASFLTKQGKLTEASNHYQSLVEAVISDDSLVHSIYLGAAECSMNMDDVTNAQRYLQKHKEEVNNNAELQRMENQAVVLYIESRILLAQRLLTEAKEAAEESLRIYEELFGSNSKIRDIGIGHNRLGAIHYQLDNYDLAEHHYKFALESLGMLENQNLTRIYIYLSDVYVEKGMYAVAMETLKKSRQIAIDQYDIADIDVHCGRLQRRMQKGDEAKNHFVHALKTYKSLKSLRDTSREISSCHSELGKTLYFYGEKSQTEAAEVHLRQACMFQPTAVDHGSRDRLFRSHQLLGGILMCNKHNYMEAITVYKSALALLTDKTANPKAWKSDVYVNIGQCYHLGPANHQLAHQYFVGGFQILRTVEDSGHIKEDDTDLSLEFIAAAIFTNYKAWAAKTGLSLF